MNDQATLVCTGCSTEKSVEEFYRRSDSESLRMPCIACWTEREKTRYVAERSANPTGLKKRLRSRNLKCKYGISPEVYAAMLNAQGGVCAICKQPEGGQHSIYKSPLPLAVDHDHETDKVRGLLCQKCNHAVGFFRDDPTIVEAAAMYLRQHQGAI